MMDNIYIISHSVRWISSCCPTSSSTAAPWHCFRAAGPLSGVVQVNHHRVPSFFFPKSIHFWRLEVLFSFLSSTSCINQRAAQEICVILVTWLQAAATRKGTVCMFLQQVFPCCWAPCLEQKTFPALRPSLHISHSSSYVTNQRGLLLVGIHRRVDLPKLSLRLLCWSWHVNIHSINID